jgi:hypothetical protein
VNSQLQPYLSSSQSADIVAQIIHAKGNQTQNYSMDATCLAKFGAGWAQRCHLLQLQE